MGQPQSNQVSNKPSKQSKKKRISRKRGKTQYSVPKDVDILSEDEEDKNHRLNLMNNAKKSRFNHRRDEGVTHLPIPRKKKYVIRVTSNSLKEYELTNDLKEAPIDKSNLFETEDEETEDDESPHTRIDSQID